VTREFTLFLCLHLLGLATRDTYELLKKTGHVKRPGKGLVAVIFAAMALLWLTWFAMPVYDPLPLRLPAALKWAGLGIVIAGWLLAIGALIQLRGVEDIQRLVTSGLFSRVRHPMYTGFILWILGWPMYYGAPVSLAVGLLGVASVLWWRALEEEAMASRYGETHRLYRKRTWF
jgi:protein-S-isoprenylcysteine O-methyltransferase Ste14